MLVHLKPNEGARFDYYRCEDSCCVHIWTALDAQRGHFVCPVCHHNLIGIAGAALAAAITAVAADMQRQLKQL